MKCQHVIHRQYSNYCVWMLTFDRLKWYGRGGFPYPCVIILLNVTYSCHLYSLSLGFFLYSSHSFQNFLSVMEYFGQLMQSCCLWIRRLTVHLWYQGLPAALLCSALSQLGVQAQRQLCMYLCHVIWKYCPFWESKNAKTFATQSQFSVFFVKIVKLI